MDTEAAFLEAALPEPVTLLHQNLLPYSLGHDILLSRIRSPFHGSSSGASPSQRDIPTPEDLFTAVLICTHRFEEAVAALRTPQKEFDEMIAKWIKLCGKELTELALLECMVTFQRYVSGGQSAPKFRKIHRPGHGGGRIPGAPFNCILIAHLLEHGFSRTEAFNCGYSLAQWLYCAHWEREGRIAIAAKGEIEHLAKLREAAAKLGWRTIKAAPGCQIVTGEMASQLEKAERTQGPKDPRTQAGGTP